MSSLEAACEAIADKIRSTIPAEHEANVRWYELGDQPRRYPEISIEIDTIAYPMTIGRPSCRVSVRGSVVVEVNAKGSEDASRLLFAYLDPYSESSVISALIAGALESPPFGGAVESFTVSPGNPATRAGVSGEIPFEFSLTSPV